MCPLIETIEDAEAFVSAVKFPPRGNRSWGPYRARLDYEGDYFTTANDWTIACPQIETRGALDELDEILALDGVDMVCFGPNDLSVALTGRLDIHAKEVKEAMTLVLRKCREMSVMATDFCQRRGLCEAARRGRLERGGGRYRCRLVRQGRRRNEARGEEQLVRQVPWSCPALCRASTNFRISVKRRDGRYKPGHDSESHTDGGPSL